MATSLPAEATDESKLLCNPECESTLEQIKLQTTPSGLQYRDIKEGQGPTPPVGFQVGGLKNTTIEYTFQHMC